MNAKKAKKLRKMAYNQLNSDIPIIKYGKYGSIVYGTGLRRDYQELKKKYNNGEIE